jgi:hypothetical protein
MDLGDEGCQARFLIRDRDGKFPDLFDGIVQDAGIQVVLSCVRMPRMNAVMERWVRTCRRELLDRTLIWDQRHLLHALREFERFYYNSHRPHRGMGNVRPLCPLPEPITAPARLAHLEVRRRATASAACSTSTGMPLDLDARGFRQAQGRDADQLRREGGGGTAAERGDP